MKMQLAKFMGEAEGKRFKIEKITLTRDQVVWRKIESMQQMTIHEDYDLEAGSYMRLFDKELNQCVMSDTPMEKRTNTEVLMRARGHVLVAGLGLGMILRPMLANKKVKKVTVVEKYAEIVDLNMLAGFDINHHKLKLVTADIFDYEFIDGAKFDVIYFDIWNQIGTGNKPGMDTLHERFSKHLNVGGWMDSWRRADCQPELNPQTTAFYMNLIKTNPLAARIIAGGLSEVRCGGIQES